MNLGHRAQSCDTCTFINNRVNEHMYQSGEECSPTSSKGKNPKSSHLKCLCTNAHSLGNRQEELEFCDQSESYDVIEITENVGKTHTTERQQWMATNTFRKIGREEEQVKLHFMRKRNLHV